MSILRRERVRIFWPVAAFASDALVCVISTASACGRRVEDRLRGPVVPLVRPALSPADITILEARMSGPILRDTMIV